MSSDLLLDVFEYLEINEIEKSQLVSYQWNAVIHRHKDKSLYKYRRIYRIILRYYPKVKLN